MENILGNHNLLFSDYWFYQYFFFWRLACDCPKGDPLWVPPILAQQCKEDGECYCPSYNGKTHSKTERGCVESSKQDILSNLHYSFPDASPLVVIWRIPYVKITRKFCSLDVNRSTSVSILPSLTMARSTYLMLNLCSMILLRTVCSQ